jgi:enoyl-CoA hydratase/carnithine racemase
MDRAAPSAGVVGESFFGDWIHALNGLEDMGKLVVAAIRGYCIGGGLQLALARDLRFCAADAVLALGPPVTG